MAPMVMVPRLSSLRPSSPPLRPRPPPDPPPSLPSLVPFEALSPQPCSSSLAQALTPHEPPDSPRCLFSRVPFQALSRPEPPDPPDASFRLVVHLHFNTPFTLSQAYIQNLETRFPNLASGGVVSFVFFGATRFGSKSLYPNLLVRVCGIITVLRPFIPSLQVLTHILTLKPPSRMATKKSGGGGLPVSASDTSFAYGLLSPVVYRYLFGCVDDTSFAYWLHFPVIYRSLFGCFDLHTSRPCKVLHAHHSSLFTIYSATVKWFRQLSVWVMLELRFMILAGDIPMGLVSFGSTFVTFSSIYIALARASAVCSSLMGFIPDVGVVFVYLSSWCWWQVEEKFIVIFIPMNMDVAGFNFPLVPRLNQSFFLIFLPIWSKLDEQVSLVLQGSSSHRMLFSAYGAVCVVLRVTLDAVFKEAYDVVVKKIKPKLFWVSAMGPMVVVLVGCLVAYLVKGTEHGIQTVGPLKKGLNPPSIQYLTFDAKYLPLVIKAGIVTGLIAMAEGIAIGRSFAVMKNEQTDGNKEMIAFGLMNIIGSFTSCYLTTGPFSKTAVNYNAGTKTPMSNVVMGLCMMLVLLFLAPLFSYTPLVGLSAIIMSAMLGLIDYEEMYHLFKVDKFDFLICMSAFFGVSFLSMDHGLIISVGLSVVRALLYVARPSTCKLGRIPNSVMFRDIEQYPGAEEMLGYVILQLGSPIFFANSTYVRERILRWIRDEPEDVEFLLLDLSGVSSIDMTGMETLLEVRRILVSKGIKMVIINPRFEVLEKMMLSHFVEKIGKENVFLSIDDAVQACRFNLSTAKP